MTAQVHERDVAAVAVAALNGADDASAMLIGPERLTQRAQVHTISRSVDRGVAVEELTRREAAERYGRFMPAHEAEAVLQFLDDAAAGNSPATEAVAGVLGRPALGFDAWAAEHAADFGAA